MNLPTEKECYSLLEQYRLPDNVIGHIMKVTDVAVFLAERINSKGIYVNVDLVKCSALLHDLARPIDFSNFDEFHDDEMDWVKFWTEIREKNPDTRHNMFAFDLFRNEYPELATVIRRHLYSSVIDDPPLTWEEKIVNYADKRVAHDQTVSLTERFADGLRRWRLNHPNEHEDTNRLERINNRHFEIEKELFEHLDMAPEELAGKINGKRLL